MAADGDDFYIAAFWELGTERQMGMGGEGQIPWHCIKDYAQFHELEHDVARAFIQVIREMDSVYLTFKAEEAETERKAREEK